jgi:SAM-dependent methyltransferase
MAENRQAPLRLLTHLNRANMRPLSDSTGTGTGSESPFATMSMVSRTPELTRLEIPSPNTFFANLTPGTRNTWGPSSATTIDNESLTSGTAERFYRPPWEQERQDNTAAQSGERESFFYRRWFTSTSPVEQVIEVPVESEDDDQPTAKALKTAIQVEPRLGPRSPNSPRSPGEGLEAIEIILEADPEQAREQQVLALSQLDRMETWLAAQRAYLPSISGEDAEMEEDTLPPHLPSEAAKAASAPVGLPPFVLPQDTPSESETQEDEKEKRETLVKKKSVRFSEIPRPRSRLGHSFDNKDSSNNSPCRLPSKLFRKESAYYRAFINYMIRQSPADVFVHRQPRFEALQAQRASLQEAHRCQLLGKYQLSVIPQSLKKRLSANVARGDAELVDDPERLRRDKEAEAADQMAMALWHVAAMKLLAGGRLIRAPVAQRLSRLSRMAPGPDGVPRDRARILDLGGQATCDWAWHCAYQYPNTKIYTVTTTAIRQLSNSNIRGPPNHRQVAVEKLTQLPFKDDQFDLISARELHAILKLSAGNGEDEWDACLQECMRVLKPGGYIEFSILDSDMINPGPLGLAKSVEFGFTLKTLGYDPTPTKSWLSRLSRAGFEDIRRAWVCLPMGEKPASRNRAPAAVRTSTTPTKTNAAIPEAAVTGGTGAVAAVCGIAAGWSWERWLLRCETEKVASERRLGIAEAATTGEAVKEAAGNCLVDVHSVVEEGRACGAAWRMVTGWARKPRAEMEIISIGLAE